MRLLKMKLTYELIKDCSRCKDCNRNVHDFLVPNDKWLEVAKENEVLCYDCFCNRQDELSVKNKSYKKYRLGFKQ